MIRILKEREEGSMKRNRYFFEIVLVIASMIFLSPVLQAAEDPQDIKGCPEGTTCTAVEISTAEL